MLPIRFTRLTACCWLSLAIASTAQADGPLLEFLDDFGKPAAAMRAPFEERIETERHDFTQSAVTVGRLVTQVEAGYTYFYKSNQEERESSHTFPETLVRVGLSEDIEFRARWNHVWVIAEEAENRIGAEDLRFGLKLQMTRPQPSEWLPLSALEIRWTAPSGGSAFSTRQAEFSLDYIYQWQLLEAATLAGSTGWGTNGFGDFGLIPEEPTGENFNFYTQSAVLGYEWSEDNTLYFEWYGIFSDGADHEFSISVLNLGIDHYITDDLVVDVRFGSGLNEQSDDFFVGVGGGFRF